MTCFSMFHLLFCDGSRATQETNAVRVLTKGRTLLRDKASDMLSYFQQGGDLTRLRLEACLCSCSEFPSEQCADWMRLNV